LLTPAGAELLPRAQSMLHGLSISYEMLKAQGRVKRDTLSIGCLPTIATCRIWHRGSSAGRWDLEVQPLMKEQFVLLCQAITLSPNSLRWHGAIWEARLSRA
jgi:hypothetical protein